MFRYTIMRPAETTDEEVGSHQWEVWEVEAHDPKEAVEDAADIPSVYYCFQCEPEVYRVHEVTKLKAVQESNDADE